jgi:hypothetical protein
VRLRYATYNRWPGSCSGSIRLSAFCYSSGELSIHVLNYPASCLDNTCELLGRHAAMSPTLLLQSMQGMDTANIAVLASRQAPCRTPQYGKELCTLVQICGNDVMCLSPASTDFEKPYPTMCVTNNIIELNSSLHNYKERSAAPNPTR